jgi:hypothetical protein
MAAITYGSHAPAKTAAAAPTSAEKPGFFARLWTAMMEARMKQAMTELRAHQHLLPAEFEIAGNKVMRKNEDQMPFVRGL